MLQSVIILLFAFIMSQVCFVSPAISANSEKNGEKNKVQNIKTVKLALNWKPEPEFGGFYHAVLNSANAEAGFKVEIQEGGSATPTVQMLAQGQVDFAILSAEEIILNNDKQPKNKMVALLSVFETSPYMIMSRKKYSSLKDLFHDEQAQISVQKGLPYVDFLIKKFQPVKAQIVPYSGGIALYENNPKLAQQGFITSEYLIAQSKKLDAKAWLVSEEGFNPYIAVLSVREEFLKKNQDWIKKFVQAQRQGWIEYLNKPEKTNQFMAQLNPAMTSDAMNQSLQQMKSLVDFKNLQFGQMSESRWDQLIKQMHELKLIKTPQEAKSHFLNL